jgi:hypothetical protein
MPLRIDLGAYIVAYNLASSCIVLVLVSAEPSRFSRVCLVPLMLSHCPLMKLVEKEKKTKKGWGKGWKDKLTVLDTALWDLF